MAEDPVYSRRLEESQLRRGDISERSAEVLGKRKTCGEKDDQDKTDPLLEEKRRHSKHGDVSNSFAGGGGNSDAC